MTKREREALQGLLNELFDVSAEESDVSFKALREANREATGHGWCCAEQNFIELAKSPDVYIDPLSAKYIQYVRATGMNDAAWKLGAVLAELGFWDEKKGA